MNNPPRVVVVTENGHPVITTSFWIRLDEGFDNLARLQIIEREKENSQWFCKIEHPSDLTGYFS
jgi:hypothetical protein